MAKLKHFSELSFGIVSFFGIIRYNYYLSGIIVCDT